MTLRAELPHLANGGAVALAAIPRLAPAELAAAVAAGVAAGRRVVAYFGCAPAADEGVELVAVLADDRTGRLTLARTTVEGDSFESLTPTCPQVHLFEREIAEQLGVVPTGHPWLKPVRFVRSPRVARAAGDGGGALPLPGVTDFYRVEGEEVHEVGVGPVHAGVIEPGHFRFQCHGEEVFHLEIALGYQHRGVERALAGGPTRRSIHYAETLAGDTSIGHATAYCQVVEGLSRVAPPARALALRAVALELERIANHVGDLGALAGDVGYLPTASFCGRLRGDFLNATAELCGSRFGRGLVRPGGVAFDVDEALVAGLDARLERAGAETRGAVEILWETPSVMARFEGTGIVSHAAALELGLTGPAARASGLDRDNRRDQPSGYFRFRQLPVSLGDAGDVLSRASVRWLEIQRSLAFVREVLAGLPEGPVRAPIDPLAPLSPLAPAACAVSLVEGWRGEICHVALTDERGRFARYKVVDPSFHNWSGLAQALRGEQISDFPLCNKSFNLSYCGHDL